MNILFDAVEHGPTWLIMVRYAMLIGAALGVFAIWAISRRWP